MCNNGRSLVCIWHIAAPDVYDGTSKSMAKADTEFRAHRLVNRLVFTHGGGSKIS